jgi:hypothetical protein
MIILMVLLLATVERKELRAARKATLNAATARVAGFLSMFDERCMRKVRLLAPKAIFVLARKDSYLRRLSFICFFLHSLFLQRTAVMSLHLSSSLLKTD